MSVDRVLEAGFAPEDSEKARATVESFRAFIEQHKDEITALQIIFSILRGGRPTPSTDATALRPNEADKRLTYPAVKELAAILEQPPHTYKGGQFAARKLFGAELPGLLDELNAVLGA